MEAALVVEAEEKILRQPMGPAAQAGSPALHPLMRPVAGQLA